jgi:hypothetical protein
MRYGSRSAKKMARDGYRAVSIRTSTYESIHRALKLMTELGSESLPKSILGESPWQNDGSISGIIELGMKALVDEMTKTTKRRLRS